MVSVGRGRAVPPRVWGGRRGAELPFWSGEFRRALESLRFPSEPASFATPVISRRRPCDLGREMGLIFAAKRATLPRRKHPDGAGSLPELGERLPKPVEGFTDWSDVGPVRGGRSITSRRPFRPIGQDVSSVRLGSWGANVLVETSGIDLARCRRGGNEEREIIDIIIFSEDELASGSTSVTERLNQPLLNIRIGFPRDCK